MTDQTDFEISSTDIAIVGMSGRFPGAADVAELWANIRAGQSGITRFSDAELREAGVAEHLLADPSYVKAAAVIEGIEDFDADFFGVGPREAQILDPQQRLYLEHNWQALEDAGCDPTRFDGAIGVFGGSAWSSYLQHNLMPNPMANAMGEMVVGLANDKDSLTTRVAHTLGLTGPAFSIQSYCSTSLVAVCVASSSLANFECDLALAGGVAVNVPHRVGYLYSEGGIAPSDAECRAFDASGQGAVLGSGVGVVALRRLSDALAAGDRIYAVIRGWAVNNDGGRKVGFTAPGVQGQAAVIAEALSSADLGAADIDYVEAHGTGTALGDASELAALQQVFSGEDCLIGSIKTNLGHLDRAAGVTNLIKTSLALHRSEIPPTRNLLTPNPQLSAGDARLEVVTELRSWPRTAARTRRAGVSAFGIGGTNAHVVLEEAPVTERPEPAARPELLVWSARTAAAAEARTAGLAEHLADSATGDRLCDVAHTLQSGRRAFEHRRVLVASTPAEAAQGIDTGQVLASTESRTDRPVGFLIAGTGEQYPGMAADLYRDEPVFRSALEQCRQILIERLDGLDPLEDMLAPRLTGSDNLSRLLGREPDSAAATPAGDRTDRLQPATFAVEYALAQLVLSWGIKPTVLAGYSVGEYVAACLSGVLSLESALALVAYRATLINTLPAGAMAAVSLSPTELAQSLRRAGIDGIDIAAVNGAQLTVVAGEPASIAAFRAFLETESVPCRLLATSHAFHSRMLEPIKDTLTAWVAERIPLAAPAIPYLSNVTGTFATTEQVTDPAYWAEHMCAPVLFEASLKTLLEQGDLALLEIGPGQSLGAMARGHQDCAQERWRRVVASLPAASDPRPAGTVLTEMVGRLWLAGVAVDWAGYQQDRPVAKVGLPGYPFQRERYWIDAPAAAEQPALSPVAVARPAVAADGAGAGGPDSEDHVQLLTPRWLPTPLSGSAAAPARHILLADGASADGVAQALANLLRQNGAEPVLARDESGLAELVRTAPDGLKATVLDLRLLDRGPELDGRDLVPMIADLINACGSDGASDASVVLVTRGGQLVNPGESPLPGHAAVAVLPVVANMEYLNLECRAVDLDPAADATAAAAALAAELAHPATEVLVAYRDGLRHLREFAAAADDPAALPAVPVRSGGTYLITGGLGGIGLVLAEHLAWAGARRLVLTSRSGAPTGATDPRQRDLERLRELGVELVLARADAGDADAMREVIAQTLATGPLHGIVHAAAQVGRDTFRPLRTVDVESTAVHFEAKVGGAQVLQTLLAELPAEQAPDFCVLFSSTSAVLGGLGFASYAAANAALTAIACRNAAGSTRWIAASWDTWANTLEQAQDGTGATMLAHSMTSEQGLSAFDRLLSQPRASVVVAAAGLDTRLPRLTSAIEEPVASDRRFPRPELPQPYSPPLTATERALAEVWAGVLGVEPVGTRDNFFDLSGNSLLALQMLALVKKRFGVAVASVTLFEAPTVHALAAVLDQQGGGLANRPASSVAGQPVARTTTAVPTAANGSSADVLPAVRPVPLAPAARTAPTRSHRAGSAVDDDDRRIAVVGMAGRFPGAGDVGTFWQNLCNGVESISFFSEEELLASGVSKLELSHPSYVPARPVLDDISGFDAGFFGISPRMAALTDPQQRLFLEVCWEALEQSGYAAAEHRGRVGVYGGANISTYLLQMPEEAVLGNDVSTYEIIMGNDKDALTTTVSYLFDLYGPSVAVQTFCSTSLVATHLAMQSLRNGECELALAGGVSIRVPNKVGHTFGPGGMESPDGHVRTFDANARGSMFGDGAAVVALKRLPDAIRDGDHIWSVLRGSAINNDGALKVGYTAPSVVGQARVIADALADAGVTGEDISYIEAHGTATELGDPIELAALTRAFGPTTDNQYCPIGSVKTNIGHLDRAAGVTGLIKTSLALREELIPASLHYTSPNPEIDFENSPFYVNSNLSPWRTRDGRLPMAGINSLGMGGTNVHVVVEQAPTRALSAAPESTARRYQVLPVSARTAAAAGQACDRLAAHLGGVAGARLVDVAYTLQVGRKTFEHRRVAVAQDLAEAAGVLSGSESAGGASLLSRVDAVRGRQLAMLFTGVGEQYPGMVSELYRREPVFAAALAECLTLLSPELPDTDLLDLLAGPRGAVAGLAALLGRTDSTQDPRAAALERTEVVQPALFAVEYALARTLQAWGVQPQVMLGYSLGEYVAACLAGVLSLPDAVALVCHRAKLIATVAPGSMIAVSLTAEQLQARFPLSERQLDIAAFNGPQVTVVAGPVPAVQALAEDLRKAEVPCRLLSTTHAFHSRMLEQVGEQLTSWVAANVRLNPPQLSYISNLTGGYAEADLVCDPGYWAKHMCQPVQFAAGAQTLLADPELAVLEVGPGQSLGALIRGAGAEPRQWPLILSLLPAANDNRPDDAVLTDALARLWLLGVELDWVSHHDRQPGAQEPELDLRPGRVPLPTYPFQRQRYWIDGAPRGLSGALPATAPAQSEPASQAPSEMSFDTIATLPKLDEDEWLHLPVWRQTARPAAAEQQPGLWLVYTRGGTADEVVARLRRTLPSTATVDVVRPGDGYAAVEDGYTVRPGNVEDTLALLRELRSAGRPLTRAVHLWALESAPDEVMLSQGVHTLVALARAAGELGMDTWSLDVVVSGTQQVLDDDVSRPYAATLTGPCRVIPLEYPNVTSRLVDLDPAPIMSPAAIAGLLAELQSPQADALVALRHGRRWLPEYHRMVAPPVTQGAGGDVLREGGVYLITGGLGGIALAMAERLARDYSAKLVLLGRNGLPERSQWPAILAADPESGKVDDRTRRRVAAVSGLLEHGAEVEIVTGDVASTDDVRRAVELALERFGALHGVLHVAGLPAMGLMQFKRPAELDLVLAPKVAGTLAIADALRIGKPDEIELDFLALFSSITSTTGGGPGQVDYCSGNAFLDSYAYQLAATGRRVLSINWGEWTWNAWEEGLTGYADTLADFFRENRARIGIGFEEGWRSLLRVLACDEPRIVVSTQDFETMVGYSSKFTVAAVTSTAMSGGGGTRHPRPELVTSYQEPSGAVETAIAAIWSESLRLEQVGAADNFFELGGNSLLGVSIVAALRAEFTSVELPPHILYEAPTVAALGRVIETAQSGDAVTGGSANGDGEDGSQVRAQLRRSGLEASAGRRKARQGQQQTKDLTGTETEQS
ncbi:MAG TPA: SDR family NAD(P)-dependent oxidoreductase [Jatrophihabitans sp.]|uniref:type I polyketide synthase n=1 Tax=Jatrophihabitans sp. TaxID=1932789 RepID=UPI002EF3618A